MAFAALAAIAGLLYFALYSGWLDELDLGGIVNAMALVVRPV